jgi:hypothetical protein
MKTSVQAPYPGAMADGAVSAGNRPAVPPVAQPRSRRKPSAPKRSAALLFGADMTCVC